MSSLFKSIYNSRFLPKCNKKYIRSDVPDHLSEKETEWLIDNNVRTIVDLRSLEEIQKRPCSLMNIGIFHYVNMPVTGGNAVPSAPQEVVKSYIHMVDDNMREIIRYIESADSKVLYFCNAGKDRTGVVSAILLSRLHVDERTIVEDYMESADNLKEVLKDFAYKNAFVDIDVITPHESYIEGLLKEIKALYI